MQVWVRTCTWHAHLNTFCASVHINLSAHCMCVCAITLHPRGLLHELVVVPVSSVACTKQRPAGGLTSVPRAQYTGLTPTCTKYHCFLSTHFHALLRCHRCIKLLRMCAGGSPSSASGAQHAILHPMHHPTMKGPWVPEPALAFGEPNMQFMPVTAHTGRR